MQLVLNSAANGFKTKKMLADSNIDFFIMGAILVL